MPALLALLSATLAGAAMQAMGDELYQQPSLYRSAVVLMLITYSLFFSAWPIYVSFPIVLLSTPLPILWSISSTVLRYSTRACLPMLSMTQSATRAIASVVCRTVALAQETARCRERQHARAQADKAAAELLRQDRADTATRATNHRKQSSSKDRRDQGRSSRRKARTSPTPALPTEPLNDSAEDTIDLKDLDLVKDLKSTSPASPISSSSPAAPPPEASLGGETTCIVCFSDVTPINRSDLGGGGRMDRRQEAARGHMPDMDHPTSMHHLRGEHLGGSPPADASLLRQPTDDPRLPRGSRALHEAAAVSWTADGMRLSMDKTLSTSLLCWSPSKPPLPSWLRTRVLKEQSSKPTPTLASRLQGAPAGRDSTTRPFAQQETPSGYTSPRMLYAPTASVSDVHTRCSATTLEPKAAAVSVAVSQPVPTCGPCGHVQNDDDDDDDDDATCILCLDAERTHAAVPCGHRSFCDGCARRAREHELPCPICRKPVQMWMRVWG